MAMDLTDYYRQLGLRNGAPLSKIKESYRRLARQFHPDLNPGDQQAQHKFIALTEAYKYLLEFAPTDEAVLSNSPPQTVSNTETNVSPKVRVHVTQAQPPLEYNNLSDLELKLKRDSYLQLQQLLKCQKYPRAIALVEGLSQRIPKDKEVRQWQAITYERWARQLINEKQIEKARIYLKKALRTDPHNRALWAEVEKDFRRLEQIY